MSGASTNRSFADELRLLPPALTVGPAAGPLRISRSKAYPAVKIGQWPTRVLRVGRCIRVPIAKVLGLLGISHKTLDKVRQH